MTLQLFNERRPRDRNAPYRIDMIWQIGDGDVNNHKKAQLII